MGGRTALLIGLLAGVLVGVSALAALILLVPSEALFGPAAGGGASATPAATTGLASPSAPSAPAVSATASSPTTATPPGAASAGASPGASTGQSADAAPGDAAFGVGRPAPPLVVPQLGGGTVDLAALRGKPVWVNFMATWCPPCQDELPVMNSFAARLGDRGLVIVAVDVREDDGAVAAFVESLGVAFPVALDRDGRAQSAWGATALPVHFWIDRTGVVRHGALGGIGPDVMAEGLRTILPGVEVTP